MGTHKDEEIKELWGRQKQQDFKRFKRWSICMLSLDCRQAGTAGITYNEVTALKVFRNETRSQ